MAAWRWLAIVFAAACAVASFNAAAQTPSQTPAPSAGSPRSAAHSPIRRVRQLHGGAEHQGSGAAGAGDGGFHRLVPGSVLRLEAHEQAISAWQAANQPAKADVLVARLLQVDPDNVRALANRAYVGRLKAAGGDTSALAAAVAASERGLAVMPKWQKPALLDDAGFAQVKEQMAGVFNGVLGFAALQAKDYDKARDHYRLAVAADPTNLQDVYQYAVAQLEGSPVDALASGTAPVRSPSRGPRRTIRPRRTSIATCARATASIAAARKAGTAS